MRKQFLLVVASLVLPAALFAADAAHYFDVAFSPSGKPIAGASVRVCTEPATTTPCTPLATIYSDYALTTPLANPFLSDSTGNYEFYAVSSEVAIEVSFGGYTTVIRHVALRSLSMPVTPGAVAGGLYPSVDAAYDLGTLVPLRRWLNFYAVAGNFTTVNVAGDLAVVGDATVSSLNKVCKADGKTGANAGEKIVACIIALPSTTGGTVDARGLEGAQTISTTVTIDKPVTLLLGNATYTLPTTGGTASVAVGGAGFYASANNVHIIGNGSTILQAARTWVFAGGQGGSWAAVGAFGVSGFEASGLDVRITVTGAMPPGNVNIQGIWVRGFPTTHDPASTDFHVHHNRVWVRAAITDDNAKPSAIFAYSGHATLRANSGSIDHNIIDDSHGRGIYLYRAESVLISDNIITHLGLTIDPTDAVRGIRVIGGKTIAVSGNTITGTGSPGAGEVMGIAVHGDTANSDISIVGNVMSFTGTYIGCKGIALAYADDVNISGNLLHYAGTDTVGEFQGIHIADVNDPLYPVTNVNVTGNSVRGWTDYQIEIAHEYATDVYIADNLLGKTVGGLARYFNYHPDAIRVRYVDNIEGDTLAAISRVAPITMLVPLGVKILSAAVNTVTFSATPTFDASLGNTQKITLTDNVTSSTLSNPTGGQQIDFLICQDGTGSRTFVWPTNVLGGMVIGSTLSKCSAQSFRYDGTLAKAYALSAGVTNM